jgi:hypothetical protein
MIIMVVNAEQAFAARSSPDMRLTQQENKPFIIKHCFEIIIN